ncbi:MAG: hypothetical protein EZS28_040529, partial [Streblomastix strix]
MHKATFTGFGYTKAGLQTVDFNGIRLKKTDYFFLHFAGIGLRNYGVVIFNNNEKPFYTVVKICKPKHFSEYQYAEINYIEDCRTKNFFSNEKISISDFLEDSKIDWSGNGWTTLLHDRLCNLLCINNPQKWLIERTNKRMSQMTNGCTILEYKDGKLLKTYEMPKTSYVKDLELFHKTYGLTFSWEYVEYTAWNIVSAWYYLYSSELSKDKFYTVDKIDTDGFYVQCINATNETVLYRIDREDSQ